MSKQKEWERRRLERLAKEAGKAAAPPVKLVEDEQPEPKVVVTSEFVKASEAAGVPVPDNVVVIDEVPQAPAEPESQPTKERVDDLIQIRKENDSITQGVYEGGPPDPNTRYPAPPDPLGDALAELQIERGRVAELQKENAALTRWKKEQLTVTSWWQKIDDYVRAHPSVTAGQSVADEALRLLKERDDHPRGVVLRSYTTSFDHIWKSFLATPAGKALIDPRLPNDYGRLIGVLEDRAKAAFTAGMGVGR